MAFRVYIAKLVHVLILLCDSCRFHNTNILKLIVKHGSVIPLAF